MKKIFRVALVAALAAGAFALHSPAQAAGRTITFTGTATVEPGFGYPDPTDPLNAGPTSNFSFSSENCVEGPSATDCHIAASGQVTGYCGKSTGGGTGTYNGESFTFTWTGAGGALVIDGTFDASGEPLTAVVNAIPPLPTEEGACSTGNAENFRIVGVGTA